MFGQFRQMMIMEEAEKLTGFVAEKILRVFDEPTHEQKIMSIIHAQRIVIFALMSQEIQDFESAHFDEETKNISIHFKNDVYNMEIDDDFKNISFANIVTVDSSKEEEVEDGGEWVAITAENIEEISKQLNTQLKEAYHQEEASRIAKDMLDKIKKN